MSKLRSLSTSFWSDPFIEELSPDQKLLFIYLITNDKTNMLGIYESSIKKIAFETGISQVNIEKYFKLFQDKGKIKYTNNYVIMVNYLKHQKFNPNMQKSAIDVHNSLPKELKVNNKDLDKSNPLKAFESLCLFYGSLPKVEVEYEVEEEVEVEAKKETVPEKKTTAKKSLKSIPIEDLHPIQIWINENCQYLVKIKDQLTFKEAESLIAKFPKPLIKKKILALENKKDCQKNYNSVYLTLNNWCKGEVEKDTPAALKMDKSKLI